MTNSLADGCVTVEGRPPYRTSSTRRPPSRARRLASARREKASAVTFRDIESHAVTWVTKRDRMSRRVTARRHARHAASRDVTIDQTRSDQTKKERETRSAEGRLTLGASPPDRRRRPRGHGAPAESPAPAKGKRRANPVPTPRRPSRHASGPRGGIPRRHVPAAGEIVRRPIALCLAAVEAYRAVDVARRSPAPRHG